MKLSSLLATQDAMCIYSQNHLPLLWRKWEREREKE